MANVKAKSKSLTATVKKQKGGVRYAFSYKIAGEKYKIYNTTKSTATFKNLKKDKTYYVRVRSYKQIGKTKLYGAYSAVKKVIVK